MRANRESPAAPPRRGTPFVARRAVNLHGCAPASRAPFPQIPAFESGCAASEGRASFVARRAVNLHGCALPHSALPPAATPPDPPVVPPVFPTAGVPQGVEFIREWGAPLLRQLRRTLPLGAPHVVGCGVPRGAHFIRERGAPSVMSSRYVAEFVERSTQFTSGFCS